MGVVFWSVLLATAVLVVLVILSSKSGKDDPQPDPTPDGSGDEVAVRYVTLPRDAVTLPL